MTCMQNILIKIKTRQKKTEILSLSYRRKKVSKKIIRFVQAVIKKKYEIKLYIILLKLYSINYKLLK